MGRAEYLCFVVAFVLQRRARGRGRSKVEILRPTWSIKTRLCSGGVMRDVVAVSLISMMKLGRLEARSSDASMRVKI